MERAGAGGPEAGAAGGEESRAEVRKGYLVSGRVQAVGFRWWTRQNARQLGLRGTVRNRADGRVELHLAGPAASVVEMRDRLEHGPRTARVEEIREVEPADGLPPEFRILR